MSSFWSLSRPSSSYFGLKKSGRNGFSTSMSQLLLQKCSVMNSDPNLGADKHRHMFFLLWDLQELRSGWFWLNVMQPGVGPIISGPGLKGQGLCGVCSSWAESWVEIGVASADLGSDLATVLLFIKSETQHSTTIVLNHLKDFSGFSVFKGKFQFLSSVC